MRRLFGILLIVIGLFILIGITVRVVPFPTQKVEKTIALDHTQNIVVATQGDNVIIVPEHRGDIKIEFKKKRMQNIHITSKKKGNILTIGVKDTGWPWLFHWGSTITIFVPMDYAETMDVKLVSGNFALDGKSMSLKRLGLDIKSGNANIKNLNIKRLSSELYSGNINMEKVVVEDQTNIKVLSGNAAIKHFSGPLNIDTMSGNVVVQLDRLVNGVTVNTKSGNVELNLPNNAGFRIKAQLKSGIIRNRLSLHDMNSGNNYLFGTHGNGRTLVTINGWSGNVKID